MKKRMGSAHNGIKGMFMKKIVIIGLGLIGGSIAKALKRNTAHRVYGYDLDEETLLDACSCGAIDGKADRYEIETADILFLCLYPEESIRFIQTHAPLLKPGCIVTDTCGTKTEICTQVERLAGENHFVFVPGHPMAGKEQSGFAASDPSIFVGASYILVDSSAPMAAVAEIQELVLAMGFGKIVRATASAHDARVAFTSQLPHVIACAYVMSPRCREHRGFSAGSYRDVSRVANINDALWSRLFLDNREPLLEEVDTLLENLQKIRNAVEKKDEPALRKLLKTAAEIKRGDFT